MPSLLPWSSPADFARALDADPVACAVYDRLAYSRKCEPVLACTTPGRSCEPDGRAQPRICSSKGAAMLAIWRLTSRRSCERFRCA
jgi:hypothetical protein